MKAGSLYKDTENTLIWKILSVRGNKCFFKVLKCDNKDDIGYIGEINIEAFRRDVLIQYSTTPLFQLLESI
jgi:hypothetical protein